DDAARRALAGRYLRRDVLTGIERTQVHVARERHVTAGLGGFQPAREQHRSARQLRAAAGVGTHRDRQRSARAALLLQRWRLASRTAACHHLTAIYCLNTIIIYRVR